MQIRPRGNGGEVEGEWDGICSVDGRPPRLISGIRAAPSLDSMFDCERPAGADPTDYVFGLYERVSTFNVPTDVLITGGFIIIGCFLSYSRNGSFICTGQ